MKKTAMVEAGKKIRKQTVMTFNTPGFTIDMKSNLKIVNVLDVTFNSNNNAYKLYNKTNNKPVYVNKISNHPTNTYKLITVSINKTISTNSGDSKIFNENRELYESGFKKIHYSNKLEYINENKPDKKNRKRNIIWLIAPNTTKTKNKKIFFNGRTIPQKQQNTVKISYSCKNNMEKIIDKNNKKY